MEVMTRGAPGLSNFSTSSFTQIAAYALFLSLYFGGIDSFQTNPLLEPHRPAKVYLNIERVPINHLKQDGGAAESVFGHILEFVEVTHGRPYF